MKKIFVCVLSLVLILSMAACGGKGNKVCVPETQETENGFVGGDPATWGPANNPEENVLLSNPWQECSSLEEAGKLAGFSFTAPEAVDGFAERYIAAIENDIAQVIFRNGDENTLSFRKGMGQTDISGDYRVYEKEENRTVDGETVTVKENDGLAYTVIWTRDGYAYAVSSTTGMDAEQVDHWVQSLA